MIYRYPGLSIHMNRRHFASGLTGLFLGVGVAGCMGESPSSESYPALEIVDLQSHTPSGGTVVVIVQIHNDGTALGSARLICEVAFEAGNRYTDERSITVEPDQTQEYRFEFEVAAGDGSKYSYDARLG